jgi:glycosyltransferase involved in cell wall biosynthesis
LSQNIKKFSIVTVCKNSKDLIEETILSVVNQTIFQKKLATLEYIIIDGYSTDGTTNIILDLKKKYSQILHFTEEDNSLFDGLTKGLKKCTGDFVAYINAGDFYNNTAFEIVNNVFNKNLDIYIFK